MEGSEEFFLVAIKLLYDLPAQPTISARFGPTGARSVTLASPDGNPSRNADRKTELSGSESIITPSFTKVMAALMFPALAVA